MIQVTKVWWDGNKLMAEPIDPSTVYKDNEVAQPDSTCSETLRAQGKAYPRTCRKCGKGPCIADRVQPEQEPSCKNCRTESPCRAKGQDLDVCSVYVPPPAAQPAPVQEPLEYWNAVEGWVKIDEVRKHFDSVGCGTIYKTSGDGRVPLTAAQRQWVGLTEKEILECRSVNHLYFYKAIEAKLKEKNT
jgi:hypothetical protein